jgi:serine/threonine-protein kinase
VDTPLTFGRYRSLFRIAAGGMAEVFAAHQRGEAGFEKVVAIKRMLPHLTEDQQFVDMFLDEARVAACINSPYVVATRDLGRDDAGAPFIVMDLIVGVTLSELILDALAIDQPMPRRIGIEIIAQTALGLDDAHEARTPGGDDLGIVHRDVSPQNIIVGADGIARLTDFGIAHAMYRRTQTAAGQLKGKVAYFSPEQARGETLDRRSDVFSLSVVAWEFLAAKRLFQDSRGTVAILEKVKQAPIPPLGELRPDLPSSLVEAVTRGLDRDRDRRFATAAELSRALRAAEGAAGSVATQKEIGEFVRKISAARIDQLERRLQGSVSTEAIPLGVVAPDDAPTRLERPSNLPTTPRDMVDTDPPASGPSIRLLLIVVLALAGAGVAVAAVLVRGGDPSTSAAVPADANVTADAADLDPDTGDDARRRAILDRACREWANAVALGQRADGAFGLERHREPWGWTTGQQLFALLESHRRCERPGDTPLRSGLAALARFRTADGWTGGGDEPRAQTPATAWAVLALAAASRAFDDPELRDRARDARDILLRSQLADGGFRFLPERGLSNGYTTVLSTWALAEMHAIGPDDEASAALDRAASWLRAVLRENGDEPPIRTVAGFHEQAVWTLLRYRDRTGRRDAGDDAILIQAASDIVARCRLGGDGRCARPTYENGQTYLEREPGQGPNLLTFWHPWTTLASHALAADETAPLPGDLRDKLTRIASWGVDEIESSTASLTAAPAYKLAEYLMTAAAIDDPNER